MWVLPKNARGRQSSGGGLELFFNVRQWELNGSRNFLATGARAGERQRAADGNTSWIIDGVMGLSVPNPTCGNGGGGKDCQ